MPLLPSDEVVEEVQPGPGGPLAGLTHAGVVCTTLVVVLYLAVAVAMTWDAWSTGAASHMQAGADQFTTVWFLRWLPFAVLHGHNPLYTDFGNYPFGVNLLNNTGVPLLGLAAAPVTLLFGPVATFNTLTTLALAGSATAGYCFARRWTEWRPAAFVAGLVYGFSPYQIAESNGGHLNLTFVVLPPLILLAVHEVIMGRARSRRRWGIGLGLLITAQFFISSEILISTLIIGACCVVAAALIGHRSVRVHLRDALPGGGWALGVAAVLLAYPVSVRPARSRPHQWPHPAGARGLPGRPARTAGTGRLHLVGTLRPGEGGQRLCQQQVGERHLPRHHPPRHLGRGHRPAVAAQPGRPGGGHRRDGGLRALPGWRSRRPPATHRLLDRSAASRAGVHQTPVAGQHHPGALLALCHPVRRPGPRPGPRPPPCDGGRPPAPSPVKGDGPPGSGCG